MKWISVEERLPEIDEEYSYSHTVLVTVEHDPAPWMEAREPQRYVYTAQLTFNGVWVDDDGQMLEGSRRNRVIGWIPLPEPMKDSFGE